MTLKHLLAGAAVAAFMIAGSAAHAQTHIVGTEGDSGFVGDVFGGIFFDSVTVASDGESAFDPFGAGYDTSDGIDFSHQVAAGGWIQLPGSNWNAIGGGQTWVLPAIDENEPAFHENVGHWLLPGQFWNEPALGSWFILEAGTGAVDDRIDVFNTERGAELRFASDPIGIPEPATWAMMLLGFFGLGSMVRSRKAAVA